MTSQKAVLVPKQELEHVGFVLNSNNMTLSLSENKKEHITQLLETNLKASLLTVRDIATIVGTLIASFPAMEYGLLFHRELEFLKINALAGS